MIVANNTPTNLDVQHITLPVSGAYEPFQYVLAPLLQPLYVPRNPQQPVTINDPTNNVDYDLDTLLDLCSQCLGDTVNNAAETAIQEIFEQTLLYYNTNSHLRFEETFVIQELTRNKLPLPSAQCLYSTATDVIPAAKQLLAGNDPRGSLFFGSLGATYHPNTLGVFFLDTTQFQDFINYFRTTVQPLYAVLPQETINKCRDVEQLTLNDLTESLLIRNNDQEDLDDLSFSRILHHIIVEYTQNCDPDKAGILPFTMSELMVPRSLVFVNVDAHAHSSADLVTAEWKTINRAIALPYTVLSKNSITKLTTAQRAIQRAANAAAQRSKDNNPDDQQAARIVFRKTAPEGKDISRHIQRQLATMGKVNKSLNVMRHTKPTFAKPSRRNPDDPNLMGRAVTQKYLPDIHLYLDYSGSISEQNIKDTVMSTIALCKKLNIDLYFNSFATNLSYETRLRIKGKSLANIYREFQRVPKVTGGTNFHHVWDYIMQSPVRQKRFNLMITDFEYEASPQRQDHPKTLYYAPITSPGDWDCIVNNASCFADSMAHIDPKIAKKFLGLT